MNQKESEVEAPAPEIGEEWEAYREAEAALTRAAGVLRGLVGGRGWGWHPGAWVDSREWAWFRCPLPTTPDPESGVVAGVVAEQYWVQDPSAPEVDGGWMCLSAGGTPAELVRAVRVRGSLGWVVWDSPWEPTVYLLSEHHRMEAEPPAVRELRAHWSGLL